MPQVPQARPASVPVNLNTLSVRWRIALDAAQEALSVSASGLSTTLPPDEIREHTQHVAREREQVRGLLEAAARTEHVKLVRSLATPTASKEQLGLPPTVLACVFDLDGVLAASADVHFAAWAETLDAFLSRHFEGASIHFSHYQRFSRRADYDEHIAGKPRLEGIRAFLASRGMTLPAGEPNDPPTADTIYGLANRKSEALRHHLEHEGVNAFEGSYRYLEAAAASGLLCAVVSASTNTRAILEQAGLADLIDTRIDGNAMRALGLRSKPAADTLVAACEDLGVEPRHAAAFETTPAGLAAARSAGFAFVVGVDRTGTIHRPQASGADVVIGDLAELLDRPRYLERLR